MSADARRLFDRLPAIYRIRDDEIARAAGRDRGPLEELLAVLAGQIAVVEESMEQLYDDLFIETCADWVVPYIGDLIGHRGLHGSVPSVASPRAEVAHTIALRRRKGTATVLEQLARDVTGWDARAVEFFELLAATQYMNHPRPHNKAWANLRDGEALEWVGTAFETFPRTVDVRRIAAGRGRHNIPNVGVFLWRVKAHPRTDCPARRVEPGQYRVSPLNHDVPLYGFPRAEGEITHLAEPVDVPLPLSRRRLQREKTACYGRRPAPGSPPDNDQPSLMLKVGGREIERDEIDVCDLSGDDGSWAHVPRPAGRYAIDPQLGRVALPPGEPDPADVRVTWHEGFGADLGGGEYERGGSFADPAGDQALVHVSVGPGAIAAALAAIANDAADRKKYVVVIDDNGHYVEDLAIHVKAGRTVEIRAGNGRRPTLSVTSPLKVTGDAESQFMLNGLLVAGGGAAGTGGGTQCALWVPDTGDNALSGVQVTHCTLVPGLGLTADGLPQKPTEPSLVVETAGVTVRIERSVVGAIRSHERSEVRAVDSVIDATDAEGVAVAAPGPGAAAGGRLRLEGCTVIGKIHAREFDTVTDSILLAAAAAGDAGWPAPVRAGRRQVGCVRFSFLPFDSHVPARHRCQPDSAEAARSVAPRFRSLRYGTPAYCQLAASTPDAVRRGAGDESEMGVFHHLYGPQRETNLRLRLDEYLRVGLEAGILYES